MLESQMRPAQSGNENGSHPAIRRKRPQKKKIHSTEIIAVLALAALILGTVMICKSCSATRSVIGTWDYDTVTVYHFEKGGRGTLELPNGTYAFSYQTDGKRLSIDFESEEVIDRIYTYKAAADKLTLTSEEDPDLVYVLTKKPEP